MTTMETLKSNCHLRYLYNETSVKQTLRNIPKCPLNRNVKKIAQCLLTIIILVNFDRG